MALHFAHDTLILDANCVIGLYASQQMVEILAAIARTVTVAAYVAEKETQWVYGGLDDASQPIRIPIALQPLINAGLLQIVNIETEGEAETVATFSAMIRDQGEAITGAIALHRHWAIALDDRKARRLFTDYAEQLQLIYTLELVKHWVDVSSPPAVVVTTALRNIRTGAKYTPRRGHPLFDWWHQHGGG